MFHATAVEVLLYLTPLHCQDMLDSLTTSLNATFTSFMKRNPAFKVCLPPSQVFMILHLVTACCDVFSSGQGSSWTGVILSPE